MHRRTGSRSRSVAAAIIVALGASSAHARSRATRVVDFPRDDAVTAINALAQDSDGFLWLAMVSGIARYDGADVVSWRRDAIRRPVSRVVARPGGGVAVLENNGRLSEIQGQQVIPVRADVLETDDMAYAPDGALWIAAGGTVHCRTPDGAWWAHAAEAFDAAPRLIRAAPDGSVFAASSAKIWRVDGDEPRLITTEARHIVALLPLSQSDVWIAGFSAVLRWRDGAPTRVVDPSAHGAGGRVIDLAARGDELWISIDRYTIVLRGDHVEVIAPERGPPLGGPLLVDREGSLWQGTFAGLVQYPEPSTVALAEEDGLPSAHARFLARTPEGLWVSTWQGLGLVDDPFGSPAGRIEEPRTLGRLCVDARGSLWMTGDPWIAERTADGRLVYTELEDELGHSCAPAADGTVWIATTRGVHRTSPTGAPLQRMPGPTPRPPDRFTHVVEDPDGMLWLATHRQVCRAPANRVIPGGDPGWSCAEVTDEPSSEITALGVTATGEVLAGVFGDGVYRFDGTRWHRIPASASLPTQGVLGIEPSPAGGTWIYGSGFCVRVDVARGADQWRVLERPASWQGVLSPGAGDVLEDPDGTLWLAGARGLTRIPASARVPKLAPPPVALVQVEADGRPLPRRDRLALPSDVRGLALSFRALSYREPARIRYRVRARDDEAWSAPTDSATFRFTDLGPGDYVAQVSASLDGETWSEPAALSFSVARPWYRQWWAWAGAAALIACALYAAHRARLAVMLRLERQRTRIARDLHDEMGSGLGSIGILASLASNEELARDQRGVLVDRIAGTAGELGASLGDLVWSLRRESETVQALAGYLARRGADLFPGDGARFEADIARPLPPAKLSLDARRNVQLIALEALHNAARHAAASRVVLGLAIRGRELRLSIEDDGRGFDAPASTRPGGGLGLDSMRNRAEELGGTLTIDSAPGDGTRVSLAFEPGRA